jgi:hypothetical protein
MLKDNLSKYWAVLVDNTIACEGIIHLHADYVEISESGAVKFMKKEEDLLEDYCIFSVSQGCWTVFYAASIIDGSACCIEHWNDLENIKKSSK